MRKYANPRKGWCNRSRRRLAARLKNFGQMLFGLLFNFSSNSEGYTKLNVRVFGVLFFFTIYIEKKKSAPILHVS